MRTPSGIGSPGKSRLEMKSELGFDSGRATKLKEIGNRNSDDRIESTPLVHPGRVQRRVGKRLGGRLGSQRRSRRRSRVAAPGHGPVGHQRVQPRTRRCAAAPDERGRRPAHPPAPEPRSAAIRSDSPGGLGSVGLGAVGPAGRRNSPGRPAALGSPGSFTATCPWRWAGGPAPPWRRWWPGEIGGGHPGAVLLSGERQRQGSHPRHPSTERRPQPSWPSTAIPRKPLWSSSGNKGVSPMPRTLKFREANGGTPRRGTMPAQVRLLRVLQGGGHSGGGRRGCAVVATTRISGEGPGRSFEIFTAGGAHRMPALRERRERFPFWPFSTKAREHGSTQGLASIGGSAAHGHALAGQRAPLNGR
jgi:hypothetical protein